MSAHFTPSQNSGIILETRDLFLRPLTGGDIHAISRVLRDEQAMYAYGHGFSYSETQKWLVRQQQRYKTDGFGLWALCCKSTGQVVGQCGLTMQCWAGKKVPEVGYLLERRHWKKGWATQGASACVAYGFNALGLSQIYAIIRDNNTASIKVAKRLGLQPVGSEIKHYHGVDMPHLVYCVSKNND